MKHLYKTKEGEIIDIMNGIHCKKHQEIIEQEKNNTGYCHSFEWEIDEDSIIVNNEYWIKINFCPFCGDKLTNNTKNKSDNKYIL